MATDETSEIEVPEGKVLADADSLAAGQRAMRDLAAVRAGIDLDHPTTELVLEKYWNPEMSKDDLLALAEKHNILLADQVPATPPPTPKVEERPGPEGADAVGSQRENLASGGNIPGDVAFVANPGDEAQKTFQRLTDEGLSTEDARVAAFDNLLQRVGEQQAYDRISARRADEARVQAALARQQATQAGI